MIDEVARLACAMTWCSCRRLCAAVRGGRGRTAGADSYAQSLAAGERIELPAIRSIATSLGARRVSERAFALAAEHAIRPVVVSDADAVRACLRFMDDHRVVVEPACGASLALAYEAATALAQYDKVLVIVCGGVTATVEQLQQWGAQP